jgi:hypothetical protein
MAYLLEQLCLRHEQVCSSCTVLPRLDIGTQLRLLGSFTLRSLYPRWIRGWARTRAGLDAVIRDESVIHNYCDWAIGTMKGTRRLYCSLGVGQDFCDVFAAVFAVTGSSQWHCLSCELSSSLDVTWLATARGCLNWFVLALKRRDVLQRCLFWASPLPCLFQSRPWKRVENVKEGVLKRKKTDVRHLGPNRSGCCTYWWRFV